MRTKGEFSVRDLVWDAAGAGSATVLLVADRQTLTQGQGKADCDRRVAIDYIVVGPPSSSCERGR